MSFRVEVEILEASGVPTPETGGQAVSTVTVAVKSRSEAAQRTRQLPGKSPVFCERFVFEGCQETDSVLLSLTNHYDDKQTAVGNCEFQVGGPRRHVGSKWVSIGTLVANIRVLWRVTQNLDWTVSLPQDTLAAIPVTVHNDETKKTHIDGLVKLPPPVDAPSSAILQVAELRAAVDERVHALEQRLQSVEELFSTRRDFDAKRRQQQLQAAGESHFGQSTFVPHPWVIASQQSAAAVKEIKYDPKTQSALQSILTSPTTLTAFDDQLATYNAAPPLLRPRPRLIGFVPANSPGAVRTT